MGSKVSNKIFNDLRMYSKTEVKRVMRLKDKAEKATGEASVDALTRLILFKWINAEMFDAIEGVIATGKVPPANRRSIDITCDFFRNQPYCTL